MSYNTKNYTEQGGEKTVIGGVLVILPGATIKAEDGAIVEGFGGGRYILPPATENALGGIIVGEGLEIDGKGTLSVKTPTVVFPKAKNQSSSQATDIEGLVKDFNELLTNLKGCGLMEADPI